LAKEFEKSKFLLKRLMTWDRTC